MFAAKGRKKVCQHDAVKGGGEGHGDGGHDDGGVPLSCQHPDESRSRIKYFGAVSQGKASTICWVVHSAVGFEVILKCTTLRRLWLRITRTNKTLKEIVGTEKKSIEHLLE